MNNASPNTVDVSRLLDEGRTSPVQIFCVLGAALTVILDGLDVTLLGSSISAFIREWSLQGIAIDVALAASSVGMVFGGTLGGWLGDRFGRRNALLGSVITFAVLTLVIALAQDLLMLVLLRFLAGFGLGGAMPNATALACEFVPRRQRPLAVTIAIVAFPIGAMLAALMGEYIIEAHGWRPYFALGGAGPLALGLLLLFLLPESPHFLARRPERWPELVKLLRRFGHDVPEDAAFVDDERNSRDKKSGSIADLFGREYRRDTLALIVSFVFCLMLSYVGILVLVRALETVGFSNSEANRVLKWWTFGGVGGALVGALAIQKIGSRASMISLSVICVVSSIAVALMPLEPNSLLTLAVLSIAMGGSLNAVQVAMYALAAHVYPTEIRARGVGTVVACARIGPILAPFVGNRVLAWKGVPGYFGIFAVGMIIVLIALVFIRRHIESASAPARSRDFGR